MAHRHSAWRVGCLCNPSPDKDKPDLIGEVIEVPDNKKAVLFKGTPPQFAMTCSSTGKVHLLYAQLRADSVSQATQRMAEGGR